jgi:hypothetical protein
MSSVFELLDHEWRHLADSRPAARRLADVRSMAGHARNLGEIERYVRASTPEESDRILLALVTRVVDHGDELAARVLLQLLMPGTRNLARRWWALGDPEERAAAAVCAVYNRIRTYPLVRRPGRVAANILLDAARELRRSVPRLVTTPTSEIVTAPPTAERSAAHELAEVLADAVADGVLDLRDARLIAHTRIAGRRVQDIAADDRLGSRGLWDRRQRAERRLAVAYAS